MNKINDENNNIEDIKIQIQLSYNLVENAFEFIKTPIEILSRYDDRFNEWYLEDYNFKTALVNSAICVELLLKAKIAFNNWKNIFNNPLKASAKDLYSGKFQSIKYSKCLEKIEEIYNIKFPPGIIEQYKKLGEIRNRLVHFKYEYNEVSFISLIVFNIDFFIEFYRKYIFIDFNQEKDRTIEFDLKLKHVKEYTKQRSKSILDEINKENHIRPLTYYYEECNQCLQHFLIILDKSKIKCMYCGDIINIQEDAVFYSIDKKLSVKCPTCTFDSLINIKNDGQECVICGYYTKEPTKWMINWNENLASKSSLIENLKDKKEQIIIRLRNL
jgi:hypothetical protein